MCSITVGFCSSWKTRPIAIARLMRALPTIVPAPPRRFCHAGCFDMPATNREKMNAASDRPVATASCQPSAFPTAKFEMSALGSSCSENHARICQPSVARMPASNRLAAGTSQRCMSSRRRAATRASRASPSKIVVPDAAAASISSNSIASSRSSRCWLKTRASVAQTIVPARA